VRRFDVLYFLLLDQEGFFLDWLFFGYLPAALLPMVLSTAIPSASVSGCRLLEFFFTAPRPASTPISAISITISITSPISTTLMLVTATPVVAAAIRGCLLGLADELLPNLRHLLQMLLFRCNFLLF